MKTGSYPIMVLIFVFLMIERRSNQERARVRVLSLVDKDPGLDLAELAIQRRSQVHLPVTLMTMTTRVRLPPRQSLRSLGQGKLKLIRRLGNLWHGLIRKDRAS